MAMFCSGLPVVELVKAFPTPFQNMIATARTCYSSRGIVAETEPTPRWRGLADSLYSAGHNTTIQHTAYQFALSRVSRHCVWSFLHSHPYYNSEQVSQRYVEVKPGNYVIPPLRGAAYQVYEATVSAQMAAYHELKEILMPAVHTAYRQRSFSEKALQSPRYQKVIHTKALEIARYVLPVATMTYLYHSVSGLTLMRYYRVCQQFDTPCEQRAVVEAMVAAVKQHDPEFGRLFQEPVPLELTPEYQFVQRTTAADAYAFRQDFDDRLQGFVSRLVSHTSGNELLVADAVRQVVGVSQAQLSDHEALRLVLDPSANPLLTDPLNVTTLNNITRALCHPHYTFLRKLSHSADSQDQRHRMTPASRPCLVTHWSEHPDYLTPPLISAIPAALECYTRVMEQVWQGIARLMDMGVSREYALYLLPNAFPIRYTESADLLNLRHKHLMRLCYNAQEEIWRASVEEAQQITKIDPLIGQYLLPPCALRYHARQIPYCPEGERYCGIPVWKLDRTQYHRMT